MDVSTDETYNFIKYYRVTFMCIAVIPYTNALDNNILHCNIGKHIYSYLESQSSCIDVIYIHYSDHGGVMETIIKLIQIISSYGKWWWYEFVLEFRECPLCHNICKVGLPMNNVNEICNVFGWECLECMDDWE